MFCKSMFLCRGQGQIVGNGSCCLRAWNAMVIMIEEVAQVLGGETDSRGKRPFFPVRKGTTKHSDVCIPVHLGCRKVVSEVQQSHFGTARKLKQRFSQTDAILGLRTGGGRSC